MIQKLRIKFTLIAMISVTLVLGIIIAGINILNYKVIVNRADEVLSILAYKDDEIPEFNNHNNPRNEDDDYSDFDFRRPGLKFKYSPEFIYESRFFFVLLSNDGDLISVDTGKIAAVDEDTAVSYAKSVLDKNKTAGFISNYRYLKVSDEEDTVRVIFYDCGRSIDSFVNFRNLSIEVSAIGLVLVFCLIVFLSGFVFRPVVESYEKQKRFVSDAGHEIKTPLAIISADAEVLEMDLEEDNEWLVDIKNQISRLGELTNELVMLSKMEDGKDSLVMSEVDMTELAEEAATLFSNSINNENKKLAKRIDENITLKCDELAIKKLFSVLLNNAIKYSSPDSEIRLELFKINNSVKIRVENDTNSSLTDNDLKHLFDRFYRPDESRNSELGGNGIGLSIAKAVVEAHKGTIQAKIINSNRFVIEVTIPC